MMPSQKIIWSPERLRYVAGAALMLNGFFPAVWIILTSLKSETELVQQPVTYWPQSPTLENYRQALTAQPLLHYLGNSLLVASLSTILTLLVASGAAYALARLDIKHKQFILTLMVASSTFPLISLLVPLFEVMRGFGLLNTSLALILPYTVLNLPVCVLVLVSFFQTIPQDLENAAMLDGCSRLGALWHVVLPLSLPGLFTAGILCFVNAWDEFLLALSFNANAAMRTAPVGIALYQGEFSFPWPLISAALVITTVPVAVVIAIFQEKVVGGLTQGGLKG